MESHVMYRNVKVVLLCQGHLNRYPLVNVDGEIIWWCTCAVCKPKILLKYSIMEWIQEDCPSLETKMEPYNVEVQCIC